LRSALHAIPAHDRQTWLAVGMGLRWTRWGEPAFRIWEEWSRTCPEKYNEADQRNTWASFERPYNGTPITLGTIFYTAKERGWSDVAAPVVNDLPVAAPSSDDAEIARLAQLPALAYERERKEAAKRLGCRESTLDKLIFAKRGGGGDAQRQGHALDL